MPAEPAGVGARRAAVLGHPIAHSLSPVLHRAAYAALGLPWTYDAIDCDVPYLTDVLDERRDWAGFSLTMPLKRAALTVADEVSPRAQAVGAANTLLPRADGVWSAHNTDVDGIRTVLQEAGVRPERVTVLGAGGTAQATVAALADLGIGACVVVVRNPGRTAEVRATAQAVHVTIDVAQLSVDAPELAADLVVSTLPPGAADRLTDAPWRAGQTVLDVVYDPWPTALASAAAAGGARVFGGARMLLHQAAAQVELMTGLAAPVEAMRVALRAAALNTGV